MEQLIKSVENVHLGRYELKMDELNFIYDNYRFDVFRMIGFVFKLGFARGQKAVKKA